MSTLLFAFWFFLPAGVANVAPILALKIPIWKKWKTPIDFGKTWNNKPILGKNKTWRGLISGIILATVTLYIQKEFATTTNPSFLSGHSFNYSDINVFLVGPLFALGALLGDLVESFFKRRQNIEAGKAWFPYDQTDYIFGTFIALSPLVILAFSEYLAILFIWFIMHLVFSYIGYRTGFKKTPI